MNFVQQFGETMRSIDLGAAIGASGFKTIDLIILAVYLVVLVGLGLFLGRTKKGEEKSANDYFLAGNTLTWWAVGASLIAANISAEQFIGMSGTGFRDGIATAAYEIMAAITLIVIGKFLLPVMLKRKIFTIPQFLRERYSDGVGLAFSILWLFLYIGHDGNIRLFRPVIVAVKHQEGDESEDDDTKYKEEPKEVWV